MAVTNLQQLEGAAEVVSPALTDGAHPTLICELARAWMTERGVTLDPWDMFAQGLGDWPGAELLQRACELAAARNIRPRGWEPGVYPNGDEVLQSTHEYLGALANLGGEIVLADMLTEQMLRAQAQDRAEQADVLGE